MKPTRKLSRRSFLGRVAGGAIVSGGAMMMLSGSAEALQITDSDNGPNSDPPGRGRGTRTGVTDSDSGPNSDSPGYGRGRRRTGITDRDSGRNADQAGNGRGRRRTGLTDGDSGGNSDPAGNGRGRRRGRCTGLTDADRGSWSDPARCGRGRHNEAAARQLREGGGIGRALPFFIDPAWACEAGASL